MPAEYMTPKLLAEIRERSRQRSVGQDNDDRRALLAELDSRIRSHEVDAVTFRRLLDERQDEVDRLTTERDQGLHVEQIAWLLVLVQNSVPREPGGPGDWEGLGREYAEQMLKDALARLSGDGPTDTATPATPDAETTEEPSNG